MVALIPEKRDLRQILLCISEAGCSFSAAPGGIGLRRRTVVFVEGRRVKVSDLPSLKL